MLNEAGLPDLTEGKLEFQGILQVNEDTFVCLDIYKMEKQ